jgi:hypothetical protein
MESFRVLFFLIIIKTLKDLSEFRSCNYEHQRRRVTSELSGRCAKIFMIVIIVWCYARSSLTLLLVARRSEHRSAMF